MKVALGNHLWRAPWAAYTDACKPADGLVTLQVLRSAHPFAACSFTNILPSPLCIAGGPAAAFAARCTWI